MALIMARPWKDPKTGVYHLKQRLPADLLRLKGSMVMLPVGDTHYRLKIGDVVQVSPRTKLMDEAKSRHARADDSLKQHWEAQRNGPTGLTHKEAVALAGKLYRYIDRTYSDDPGPPNRWLKLETENLLAKVGRYAGGKLLITPEAQKDRAREDRYGGMTDALLAHVRQSVDPESRDKLLKAVQQAIEELTEKLRWNAFGDYSPDLNVGRFPAWEPKEAKKVKTATLPITSLFRLWEAAHKVTNADTTIRRYEGIFRSLAAFFNDHDVNGLTGDHIHAWATHRCNIDKVSPKTINSVDLVALTSVFKWAKSREGGERMTINPAEIDKLSEPRSKATRVKHFYEAEIKLILDAASATAHDKTNPTLSSAKRWCPWLAAYSGARVTELTALTGGDVRLEDDIAIMEFKDTKTNQFRAVPVHEHLLEQDFMTFAASCGSKPLFYDVSRAAKYARSSPAQSRSKSLAKWIRDDLNLDPEVKPDHGWRHTWKNRALEVGIATRISDAITGHTTKTVSDGYQHPTLKMMARAMAEYPRYEVV